MNPYYLCLTNKTNSFALLSLLITQNTELFSFSPFAGNDVVIVKNGRRICGSGGALANAPIVQNKAYFEIKVQCGGKNCHCKLF